MKRSLRTPLRRAGDERLDGVPASAARQDRRDMLQRIEVTVDCLDGTSETEFDLPTLEQAIDEHAEDPVESCNGSYVNVVHDRMHGPLVTPNWGREFTGRIVMEDPSIGVAELYSGSLAPTHAVLDLNYKCTELLPDNNYDSPLPGWRRPAGGMSGRSTAEGAVRLRTAPGSATRH